ncbi:hypothetical protein [Blastococcus sp. SYSU D00813]
MSTTSPARRWRTAAAGLFIAASAFSVAACGEDVVDDDVEQNIEEGVDDAEQEVEEGVEDATDGPDDDGDG